MSSSSSAVDALDSALESLSVQLFAKDASAAKSATNALFAFAAANPRTIMRSLPKLEAALADDNYSKRSAVSAHEGQERRGERGKREGAGKRRRGGVQIALC